MSGERYLPREDEMNSSLLLWWDAATADRGSCFFACLLSAPTAFFVVFFKVRKQEVIQITKYRPKSDHHYRDLECREEK